MSKCLDNNTTTSDRTQAPSSSEAIEECGGIDLLDAGLRAAERGWRIFPCDGRKKPIVKHWREEATTDEATIKASEAMARSDVGASVACGRVADRRSKTRQKWCS
jgi:hypothetical protein